MVAFLVAASDLPAAPIVALMGAGVVVAIVGHASRNQRTAVIGIVLIFLATALLILGAYFAYQDDTSDPRPDKSPQTPAF